MEFSSYQEVFCFYPLRLENDSQRNGETSLYHVTANWNRCSLLQRMIVIPLSTAFGTGLSLHTSVLHLIMFPVLYFWHRELGLFLSISWNQLSSYFYFSFTHLHTSWLAFPSQSQEPRKGRNRGQLMAMYGIKIEHCFISSYYTFYCEAPLIWKRGITIPVLRRVAYYKWIRVEVSNHILKSSVSAFWNQDEQCWKEKGRRV